MAISDNLESNASDPKSAAADGVSASQHSLREQIEADRYLKERGNRSKSSLPIRMMKVKPKAISPADD